jgi:SAM-dependent methyltransferase
VCEYLSSTVESAGAISRGEMLRRFLNAYWLRPENALWMTLRSETLAKGPWQRPSIDICGGDGVFSFLHMGGRFDPEFDVFTAVGRLEEVRTEHADMFDHADDAYAPKIIAPPRGRIDVCTDLKANLLKKARALSIYDRLILHDCNNALPFDNSSFQTAFCNAAYWIENIDGFLRELRRIVHPDGHIILQVKLDCMRRYTLECWRRVLGDRFLDIIGRRRMECWPSLADRKTWEERFHDAGLRVEFAEPFITRTHAHIWDIGLRPIAPMLIKMANALTPETKAEIKNDWVDLFCELLTPICDAAFDLMPEDEPAEIQYLLARR